MPWHIHEFQTGGKAFKVISVVIAPAYILCKWTCPAVHYNDLQRCWNKVLAVIQAVLIPFLFYVLLRQYEADPFGGGG